jgi:hypothetical protein
VRCPPIPIKGRSQPCDAWTQEGALPIPLPGLLTANGKRKWEAHQKLCSQVQFPTIPGVSYNVQTLYNTNQVSARPPWT